MFDWALEADAPQPHPDTLVREPGRMVLRPEKLVHWERAVVRLRRHGVPRASWPGPFETPSYPAEYKIPRSARTAVRQVGDDRRRELLKECDELRCREHVYFSSSELNDLLRTQPVRVPVTPRTFATEDAVYVYGADAAAQLLLEDLVPSRWPDVYELGEGAEPERVADRSDGIRRLFRNKSPGRLFVLQHRLRQLCPQAQRAAAFQSTAIRNAVDAQKEFNRMMTEAQRYIWESSPPASVFAGPSSTNGIVDQFNKQAAGVRGFPDANVGGQTRESGAAASANAETAEVASTEAEPAPAEQQVSARKLRAQRRKREVAKLRSQLGPSASAKEIYGALAAEDGYSMKDGTLIGPDGKPIALKTVENDVTELS
jgi:hypothetical protein